MKRIPNDILKKKPLYFLHISKTGGTTLIDYLDSQFIASKIFPFQLWDQWWEWRNNNKLLAESKTFSQYQLFRGHFGYDITEEFGVSPYYITLLRDPVERSISNYYHVMREYNNSENFESPFIKQDERLEDIVNDQKKRVMLENEVITYLAVDSYIKNYARDQLNHEYNSKSFMNFLQSKCEFKYQEWLKISKKRIKKFSFVGITEFFTESLLLLAYIFNFKPIKGEKKLNAFSRPQSKILCESVVEKLRLMNVYDYEFYDEAKKLFLNRYLSLLSAKLNMPMDEEEFMENRVVYNEQLYQVLDYEYRKTMAFTKRWSPFRKKQNELRAIE